MTFAEFCACHEVGEDERDALAHFLAGLRWARLAARLPPPPVLVDFPAASPPRNPPHDATRQP